MDPSLWSKCPVWFVPAFFLWMGIVTLADRFHTAAALSKRFGWDPQRTDRWLEIILAGCSYVIVFIILVIISVKIDFDLIRWFWHF